MPPTKIRYAQRSDDREVLSASRTYWVSTSGSDSNNGLASGTPFLTIQKAVDVACTLDLSLYNVLIQIADGTYNSGVITLKKYVGAGTIQIAGNAVTPSNVKIVSSGIGFLNQAGVTYSLYNMRITPGGNSISIYSDGKGSQIQILGVDFASAGALGTHIIALNGGLVYVIGNYTISGGAYYHLYCLDVGQIVAIGLTCTISGSPAFTIFAYANSLSEILSYSMTWTGAATGARYSASLNSVINTYGGGANYFPGNSAGSVATGGVYA